MATTITAGNATNGAAVSSDNTGILELKTGTGSGTTAITVNASQNVGIGTSSPATILNAYNATSAIISVDGDSTTQFRASRYSSDTSPSQVITRKARGTLASPSAVNSGDSAGALGFQVFGGTNFRNVAQVLGLCETYTSDTNVSGALTFSTNAGGTTLTEQARITAAGLFQFNSGYGSVATVYGCRAWVNFNGTGTVAIRASGNVTSITDNGTGDYTVNFTTAMPDANYGYACSGSIRDAIDNAVVLSCGADRNVAPTSSAIRINTVYINSGVYTFIDGAEVCTSIFR